MTNKTEKEIFSERVKSMYKNGCSIKEIAETKEKSQEEIYNIIIKLDLIQLGETRSSGIIGNKAEPYYANENINNIPKYKYEELSKTEREFYESRIDK